MKALVLEDTKSRIQYFIKRLDAYDLHLTDNAYDTINLLNKEIFNLIFLDNDLGDNDGSGIDVARFLYEHKYNKNNDALIIVHSWNIPAVTTIRGLLPRAYFFPFGSKDFFNLSIDK